MDAIAFVPKRRLLIAIAIALASSGATAATITVGSNDDRKVPKFCTLREALTSINNAAATAKCSTAVTGTFGDDDTIVFSPPLADSVITLKQGELTITKPLTITGSGQTIDAGGESTAIYVDYAALTASDLTVQNGYSASRAGGIVVLNGTLTLNHVTLAYNRGNSGGAIFALSSVVVPTLSVTDSHIHNNYANVGGAIESQGGTLTVSGTMIENNVATGGGGGIGVDSDSATVTDSLLVGNAAPSGGAILSSGYLLLQRSIIAANSATNGAGVSLSGSGAVLESTISSNSATGDGGAISAGTADLLITGSTISGNSAQFGGALSARYGSVTIRNSTLTSNTASESGGAMFGRKYPAITLANVTISGNTAASGGAILFAGQAASAMHSFNSIVSANSAASSPEIGGHFRLTGNNNLFGTTLNVPPYNDTANNNIFSDAPGLGPVQSNGGLTDTMALLAGSPAIDAGSNDSAAGLTTDQRGTGFPRVVNGTVDIGAYESGDHIFADGFESGP